MTDRSGDYLMGAKKGSYNEERERWYQAEVRNNARHLHLAVEADDGTIYLVAGEERELLCRPRIANRFWYDTWLALKQSRGDLPYFILRS
jgi:hypothetical protein